MPQETLPRINVPELNPYRVTLDPGAEGLSPGLVDFFREQTETLRFEHNKAQAGDTTFHWSLATYVTPQALYNLGSIGRFFHPDYGLIHARYVRIGAVAEASWRNGPVGLQRNQPLWTVTDQQALSSAAFIVGIPAWYDAPTEGSYGWVIEDGVNLVTLAYEGSKPGFFTEFGWDSDGVISSEAQGEIIGGIVSRDSFVQENGCWLIPPGGAIIRRQGAGRLDMSQIDLLGAELHAIDERLGVTEEAYASLKLGLNGTTEAFYKLNLRVTRESIQNANALRDSYEKLSAEVKSERSARLEGDTAIASSLEELTASYVRYEDMQGALSEWTRVEVDAKIRDERIVRASADEAMARTMTEMNARIVTATGDVTTAIEAAINEERLVRVAAEEAIASRVTTIEADYVVTSEAESIASTAAHAAVTTEETARALADTALSDRITTVEASYTTTSALTGAVSTLNARIDDEVEALADADTALATSISTVSVTVGQKNRTYRQPSAPSGVLAIGDVWYDSDDSNKPYRWDGTAWALTDDTRIGGISASVTTLSGVVAGHTGDIADLNSDFLGLSGTVSTHTGQIGTLSGNDAALFARWGVRIDVNGYISGIVTNNNGASSDFIIRADTLKVVESGVAARTIFEVTPTYAKFLGKLQVDGLLTGVLNADMQVGTGRIVWDNGTTMLVQGNGFGTSNQFIQWFGPSRAISACNEASATVYLKTNGDAYFGGTLSSGTLKNQATSTTVSATANIDVGPFASNGDTININYGGTFTRYQEMDAGTGGIGTTVSGTIQLYTSVDGGANWTYRTSIGITETFREIIVDGQPTIRDKATWTMSGGGTFTWTPGVGTNMMVRAIWSSRPQPTFSGTGLQTPILTQRTTVICVET